MEHAVNRTYLTVPTRGSHPDLLGRLVTSSGLDRKRIVIVKTDPDAQVPEGVSVLEDYGSINIQRWWNRGIQFAQQAGAEFVVVSNDDVEINSQSIPQLVAALQSTGAALATPGDRLRHFVGRPVIERKLDGGFWALRLASGLRPDATYNWAYGDDDLDVRARLQHGGLVTVPTHYLHVHLNVATSTSTSLNVLSRADEKTFRHQHPWVWWARRPRHHYRSVRARLRGR